MVSEKTNHPMWRIVRKGTLPAFSPQNMRCRISAWDTFVFTCLNSIREGRS